MYTQGASYDVCVWARGGGDWLRHMDYWGCLWASWGDLQARYLQWLVVGLPGGICEVISRLHIHSMPSKSPGSILPAPADPLVIQHSSVFWMGWEGSGTFWQHPAQLEKLGTHPHTLTSPPWKKSGAKNVSLGTELWCPGGGVMQVNEIFHLPSSVHLFSDIVASVVCWHFSAGLLGVYKVTLVCGWLPISVFLDRR